MITRRGWMAAAGSAAAMALFTRSAQAFPATSGDDPRAAVGTAEDELCARAWRGLAWRIRGQCKGRGYAHRLHAELAALTSNPASARKLLALNDMVTWARSDGIPVGPGRGSAPGSIVCWALGITSVDPIRYDLLFERFYSSAKEPLVDLHVCARRRDELLDRLVASRAEAEVAVLRPTAGEYDYLCVAPWRLFDMCDRSRIAQLVRDLRASDAPPPGVVAACDPTIAAAYHSCPEIRRWCEDTAANPDDPTLCLGARKVLVSAHPLPTSTSHRSWPVVEFSAYERSDDIVEFDLTGDEIVTLLGATLDTELVTDSDLWRFFASGATEDVYQLEVAELRRLLQRVQPESIEDVAATIAVHRPGPIEAGWAEELVAARSGRRRIDPMHSTVATILAPTKGLIIYQEQLIRIVAEVSGLSLAASNQVRRDLAARRDPRIDDHRKTFVAGAGRRGCATRTAQAIFARLERDAGYTFSRAHAIAETTLTLRSARHVLQAGRQCAAS